MTDRSGEVFVKRRPGAPEDFFEAEVNGLHWLAEARCVAVPRVIDVQPDRLTLQRIPAGRPSPLGAEQFGRALARLHGAGASGFGAPWSGYIGPLPMDNRSAPEWPTFYRERRVIPFLRAAVDRATLSRSDATAIERALELLSTVPGGNEPPSRLHGDLWSGNVLWDHQGRAWLIDPAAHGGHRETDLAMLALFGAPHLEHILSAYTDERPLAEGWRQRVGLHQLHPLLVHAVLFGGSYGRQAGRAAQEALSLWGRP